MTPSEIQSLYASVPTEELERAILDAAFDALGETTRRTDPETKVGEGFGPFENYVAGNGRHVRMSLCCYEEFSTLENWTVEWERLTNGAYPLMVARHDQFLLMVVQCDDPESGPKSGYVREELNRDPLQPDLFKDPPGYVKGNDKPEIAGQILHSPRKDDSQIPGVLEIRFPNYGYDDWLHSVDILRQQRDYYVELRQQLDEDETDRHAEEVVENPAAGLQLKPDEETS